MNRNNLSRFVLVVLVLLWSIYEIWPPTGRDLIQVFRDRAVAKDPTFYNIVSNALVLQKDRPEQAYENLTLAVGTNDLTRFFPFFEAKNETHPTTYILNRLQREAAGRIHLGLDLQGGTSFLMEMNTNALGTNAMGQTETQAALDQAVEVLRRRVDRFGVAEPVIQPQ